MIKMNVKKLLYNFKNHPEKKNISRDQMYNLPHTSHWSLHIHMAIGKQEVLGADVYK